MSINTWTPQDFKDRYLVVRVTDFYEEASLATDEHGNLEIGDLGPVEDPYHDEDDYPERYELVERDKGLVAYYSDDWLTFSDRARYAMAVCGPVTLKDGRDVTKDISLLHKDGWDVNVYPEDCNTPQCYAKVIASKELEGGFARICSGYYVKDARSFFTWELTTHGCTKSSFDESPDAYHKTDTPIAAHEGLLSYLCDNSKKGADNA